MNNLTIIFPVLHLLRRRLESIEIKSPLVARFVCQIILASCPFERKIKLFNQTILSIPPLCKLNPFYEQFVALRFKSLVYLEEKCGKDRTFYYY
ncbi:MAG: Mo-dependent nitrogenase C-terminal domain-containing protein [Xenococcaceae cyanobacterium MO_234.B1]|nr:Mo-dependent nitrogenase C-terminal domain-containing protein [Xenococcaceae cyanobacterium MO_234.B1]